jgi:hypothetical protein
MGEYRLSDFHLTLLSKENSSSRNFVHSFGTKRGNLYKNYVKLFLLHNILVFVNVTIHLQPKREKNTG